MFYFHELTEPTRVAEVERRVEGYYDDTLWAEGISDDVATTLSMIGVGSAEVRGWDTVHGTVGISGQVEWQAGGQKRVRQEYPQWTELHALVDQLQAIQQPFFYQLSFGITDSTSGTDSVSSGIYNDRTGDEPYQDDPWESDRFLDLEHDIDEWVRDMSRCMGRLYSNTFESIPETAEEDCRDAGPDYDEQGVEDEVDGRIGPHTKILMIPNGWRVHKTPAGESMVSWLLETMQPGEVRDLSQFSRHLWVNPQHVDIVIDDPRYDVPYIPIYALDQTVHEIEGLPSVMDAAAPGTKLLQAYAVFNRLQEVCHGKG